MGIKVTVDLQACQGYACCMMTAPAVFDMDETVGKAIVLMPEPGEDLHELLEKSARGCPASAITLESR